ncbi:MAG: T9SS type A sorting domain-containing protein [Phycisphaerae bacterium]|nr:T9SS type A sorting domain-containing protein [Saprospiraceae bacterium]
MKPAFFGQPMCLLLLLIFTFLSLQMVSASIVYSKQSGTWSTASTWEGNAVPSGSDYVIIKSGHTVTNNSPFFRNGNLDIDGVLVLPNNVARTFSALSAVEISGELRLESGTLAFAGQVYGGGLYRQIAGVSQFIAQYDVTSTDLQGGTATFAGGVTQFGYLVLKNTKIDNANGQGEFLVNIEFSWLDQGYVALNTTLNIQSGAFLQFAANATFKNDGLVKNYGTAHCTSGTLTGVNANLNFFFNYGLWEIDVPAGKTFKVDRQSVDNKPGGTFHKNGSGTIAFTHNSSFSTLFGDNTVHIQAGICNLIAPVFYPHKGTWQVDAGATLNFDISASADRVKFAGPNFLNNGAVKGAAIFELSGDDNTALEGGGNYSKVEINKTGGAEVILTGSPEITDKLILTEGQLVLNQYDLWLGKAYVDTGVLESYIETNGLGSCVRYCPVNTHVNFPVGKGTYSPFGITVQTGSQPDYFKIRTTNSFYGEYLGIGFNDLCNEQVPEGVVGQIWQVSENVSGNSTAQVTAQWWAGAEQNNFNRNNCTVGRYFNGDWHPTGFSAAQHQSFYFQDGIVSAFGLFGVFDEAHEANVNFVAPAPTANSPLCEWADLQLHSNTSAEVQWTGPNGFQSASHDPLILGIQQVQGGWYVANVSQYGCPAQSVSVNVQVYAEPSPSIIGPDEIQPNESAILTADGGSLYHWSTGATTKSIIVWPTQTTDYQVSVTNPSGCSASVLHTVQVSEVSAMHEVEAASGQMKMVPNPAFEASSLIFESTTSGEAQITIADARGAQLSHQNIFIANGLNQVNVSLANFPAGIYQVALTRDSEVKTIRLVKMVGE